MIKIANNSADKNARRKNIIIIFTEKCNHILKRAIDGGFLAALLEYHVISEMVVLL